MKKSNFDNDEMEPRKKDDEKKDLNRDQSQNFFRFQSLLSFAFNWVIDKGTFTTRYKKYTWTLY